LLRSGRHSDTHRSAPEEDRAPDLGCYRIFREIRCQHVQKSDEELSIELLGNDLEWLCPGGKKIFVRRSITPSNLVQSIDSTRKRNRGKYGYYMRLDQQWYLKYIEVQ
jgi:hypothetical protein